MEKIIENIFIVGSGCMISLITNNIKEAKKMLKLKKEMYPNLDWGIRSIPEAIENAYDAGYYSGHSAAEEIVDFII